MELAPGMAEMRKALHHSAESLERLIGGVEDTYGQLEEALAAIDASMEALDDLLTLYQVTTDWFAGIRDVEEVRVALGDARDRVEELVTTGAARRESGTVTPIAVKRGQEEP